MLPQPGEFIKGVLSVAKIIIIADDSKTVQKVVDLILSPQGYIVKAFDNGKDVLHFLEEHNANLIFADTSMPNINGFDLGISLKEKNILNIPLILMFGDFTQMDSEKYLASGAVGRIEKPFDSKQLLGVVKKYASQDLLSTEKDEQWNMDDFDKPQIPKKNLKDDYELNALNENNNEDDNNYEDSISINEEDKNILSKKENKELKIDDEIPSISFLKNKEKDKAKEINEDTVFDYEDILEKTNINKDEPQKTSLIEINHDVYIKADEKEELSLIENTKIIDTDDEKDLLFIDDLIDENNKLLENDDFFTIKEDSGISSEKNNNDNVILKDLIEEDDDIPYIHSDNSFIYEEEKKDLDELETIDTYYNEDNLPPHETEKLLKAYNILEKEDGSIEFLEDNIFSFNSENILEDEIIDTKDEINFDNKDIVKTFDENIPYEEASNILEEDLKTAPKEALWETITYNEEALKEEIKFNVSDEIKNIIIDEIRKIIPELVEKIAREEINKLINE